MWNDIQKTAIVNDYYELATLGYIPLATFLNLIFAFKLEKERSFLLWKNVLESINDISSNIDRNEIYQKFNQFVKKISEPLHQILAKLTLDDIVSESADHDKMRR